METKQESLIVWTESELQRAAADFAAREVYCCASTLVSELAQHDQYMDDLMEVCSATVEVVHNNQYRFKENTDYSEATSDIAGWFYLVGEDGEDCEPGVPVTADDLAAIEQESGESNHVPDMGGYLIEQGRLPKRATFLDEYDDPEMTTEDVEAYEHWIVSDWLARHLEARGEMVTHDFMGLTIWGRTCSGQAIAMDEVIRSVVLSIHNTRLPRRDEVL